MTDKNNSITDEDLLIKDYDRSLEWNYVDRVEYELGFCDDYNSVLGNKCLPLSYKEILAVVSRGSNSSRTSLLLDDDELVVAFVIVVDEDAIPFMLDCLEDVFVPINAVFKVFYDNDVAFCKEDDKINTFIQDVVIPDLNMDDGSWKCFKTRRE